MSATTDKNIPSFSHTATTEKLLELIGDEDFSRGRGGNLRRRILDLGAGAGYLTWKLHDLLESRGCDPSSILTACDLNPELFQFDKLPCIRADFTQGLPFEDGAFDLVCCMEVIEHVPNQMQLMNEIARVTKPGGRALITTPNLLTLNARLRYLFTGTMPLFDIMPISEADAVHVTGHISPISLYYLYYFAKRAGFRDVDFHVDRIKKSAAIFSPLFYVASRICKIGHDAMRRNLPYWQENRKAADAMYQWQTFVGRTIIAEAKR